MLSNAGHIASLVNPPGNPKASYYIDGDRGTDPDIWFKSARKEAGTWWTTWADWAIERAGDETEAPKGAGSARFTPLQPAPGSYVRDRVPK